MREKQVTPLDTTATFNGLNAARLGDPSRVGRMDDCKNCGLPYVVKTKNQKCCSDGCRVKYWHLNNGGMKSFLARLSAVESTLRILTDANTARRITDLNRRIQQTGEYQGPERRKS